MNEKKRPPPQVREIEHLLPGVGAKGLDGKAEGLHGKCRMMNAECRMKTAGKRFN
jgi:hypothetical protein